MDPLTITKLVAASKATLPKPCLGELWTLPSDHLPIAAEVLGVKILSWNILNRKFLHHLLKDQEGLANSILITENVCLNDTSQITVRESRVVKMIHAFSKGLDLILLQEVSPDVIGELSKQLDPNWKLIRSRSTQSDNDCCAIFNSARLELIQEESEIIENAYPSKPRTPIMNMQFKMSEGSDLRVLHTHVPGDPSLPGLQELAHYLANFKGATVSPLVLAGDLNFTEDQIRLEMEAARLPPFKDLNLINTVIGLDRVPKRIDHILWFGSGEARSISSSDLGVDVANTAAILSATS